LLRFSWSDLRERGSDVARTVADLLRSEGA
jgi:hypothetical protein